MTIHLKDHTEDELANILSVDYTNNTNNVDTFQTRSSQPNPSNNFVELDCIEITKIRIFHVNMVL